MQYVLTAQLPFYMNGETFSRVFIDDSEHTERFSVMGAIHSTVAELSFEVPYDDDTTFWFGVAEISCSFHQLDQAIRRGRPWEFYIGVQLEDGRRGAGRQFGAAVNVEHGAQTVRTGEEPYPADEMSRTASIPHRRRLFSLWFPLVALALCATAPGQDNAIQPRVDRLRVPDGFVVEQVAAPPLVSFPMMACLDGRGRLFIAESDGVNREDPELLEKKPHRIVLVEDVDGDGRFDRRTVFADNMVLPNGALWHDGALYVASPPGIWRLRDTDGDDVADERLLLQADFNFSGMSDSLHGPVLGPDGRLYWCGGQHGYRLTGSDREVLYESDAPGVFSCRLDGSDPLVQGWGGLANPVEVTFTPEGEVFGTLAILDNNDGRHDALLHWIYGGVFNLPEHKLAGLKRTGDILSPLSRFGQVAPAGVMRYRGTAFGEEFRDNIFLAQFNTHRVVRTRVERSGATFRSRDEDFLVSSDPDTHFTDVLEDADGSLLVIDTGGWFRYGCPTSQIAKPQITGAVYRVRRVGAPAVSDARGLLIRWDDVGPCRLAALLDDTRPVVRDKAVVALVKHGDNAVAVLSSLLESSASVTARRNAVWTLCRIDTPSARAAIRAALSDESDSVRHAAVRSLTALGDEDSFEPLCRMVVSDVPQIRRQAATALGRTGRSAAVGPLLESLRNADDRFLEHALVYALIEIGDPAATRAGLDDPVPDVRRGALVALDQMGPDALARELVARLLDTDDARLERAALEVISRHGWADEISSLVSAWLAEPNLPRKRHSIIRGVLLSLAQNADIQRRIATALTDEKTAMSTRLLLLEVMARSEVHPAPASWNHALTASLNSDDEQVVRQAVLTLRSCHVPVLDAELRDLAEDESRPARIRLEAAAVVAAKAETLDDGLFRLLARYSSSEVEAVDRLTAAGAIGGARLLDHQLRAVAGLVASADPLTLPALIAAFENHPTAAAGPELVRALAASPSLASLTRERLKTLFARYPKDVKTSAEPLLARLASGSEEQAARLAELADVLEGGQAERGRELFFGRAAACSACHRVEGQGGNVGPELSRIGEARTRRDLLEAIVFPSASQARGFESLNVATSSGRIHTGVLVRETVEAIYLRTSERAEIRIARADIEELAPASVSVMPQGLDRQLSRDELRDLLAFLASRGMAAE